MKETLESIVAWHRTALPQATLDGQITKFNEEWDEYFYASNDKEKLEELADVFIVAFGMNRFDLQEGLFYMNDAWQLYSESPYTWEELYEAINTKMEKNRSRAWKEINEGEYHHVEGE